MALGQAQHTLWGNMLSDPIEICFTLRQQTQVQEEIEQSNLSSNSASGSRRDWVALSLLEPTAGVQEEIEQSNLSSNSVLGSSRDWVAKFVLELAI